VAKKRLTFLLVIASTLLAHAQLPISAEDLPQIAPLFDTQGSKNTLHCSVIHLGPMLDFTLRHEVGILANLTAEEATPGNRLVLFLRVTPLDGQARFFGENFDVPPIPPEALRSAGAKHLDRIQFQMSAGFAIGEGRYAIDLLMKDREQHACRKHWTVKTPRHSKLASPSLPPNTVAPMDPEHWDGRLYQDGVRLTVFLHVAPINPDASKLHAWDNSFLLQSLATLLTQIPCQSVRVIGFSLDKQEKVFYEEHFDSRSYGKLVDTLHQQEFATVRYQALQRGRGTRWLMSLVHEQTSGKSPSDVVVILGPTSRLTDKVFAEASDASPHFFYFEYYPTFGNEFPDSIDFLTRGMHGTVYKIHSADQLGQAIQKMMGQIRPAQKIETLSISSPDAILRWQAGSSY